MSSPVRSPVRRQKTFDSPTRRKAQSALAELALAADQAEQEAAQDAVEPVPIRAVFRSFRHPTTVHFTLGATSLAFSYVPTSKSFTCLNRDNRQCLRFIVENDHVYLSDYFYKNGNDTYQCEMAPRTMAEHDQLLVSLMDFVAYVFKKHAVKLSDASFKTYDRCTLPQSVFLVAGKQSFYQRFGYEPEDANFFAAALFDTQETKDRVTLKTRAAKLVRDCKAGRRADQAAIDFIDATFKSNLRAQKTTMYFYRPTRPVHFRYRVHNNALFVDVTPRRKMTRGR